MVMQISRQISLPASQLQSFIFRMTILGSKSHLLAPARDLPLTLLATYRMKSEQIHRLGGQMLEYLVPSNPSALSHLTP